MNAGAEEAERRRPGTSHHEAAHAVHAHDSGEKIAYVMVGEESACKSEVSYRRGDLYSITQIVCGLLVGKYAEDLARTGEPRQHVPFDTFSELVREWWASNEAPEGFEDDDAGVYNYLVLLEANHHKQVYQAACISADKFVKDRWKEIDAVANRLRAVGRIDGAEVARLIKAARAGTL